MIKNSKVNFIVFFLILSLIFSFILSEDTLGGARHDYLFHEKFIFLFAENFSETFNNYGKGTLYARNSPIFYIFLSLFYKIGLDLNTIRYLNFFSVFILCYLFYDCLKIQFKEADKSILKLLSFVILLSPTVRSLAVWPYPILYAFIFFLLSVKYYLLFTKENNNIMNALNCTFYLALASYLTPNFCVFSFFFFYQFYLKFGWSKNIIKIIFLNLILSAPAILYYYYNDFYLFKYSGGEINYIIKYNIFNKIIIISTILMFYLIPLITKKIFLEVLYDFKKINNIILIILLFIICNYIFNFPSGFGGGIFYHISNKITYSNYLLYIIFIISYLILEKTKLFNLNNIILFICLIFYNLQFSIYHKYFDPLLLFIFLFLLDFTKTKIKISLSILSKKYYILYILFLFLSLFKTTI